jgi:hypothetical protein
MSALGPQFMSINELKGLKTIDAPSGDKTVGDLLDKKRGEILDAPEYNSVRQNMKRQGQTAPLGVSKNHDWLLDGHHRVAIAEDLGWEKMEVSSDVLKSSDLDFDKKHGW